MSIVNVVILYYNRKYLETTAQSLSYVV